MFKLRPLPLLPLMILVAITFFSIITLYSACAGNFFPWCEKQLWRVLLGIIVLIVVANIKFSVWKKYGFCLYLICLLALIAVEVMGKISMGAQRWLKLGTLTLQPAEFMRIVLIMVLARYFSIQSMDDNRRTKTLLIPTFATIIPVGFVLLQPDLGTAMLLILVFLSILFACGVQEANFNVFKPRNGSMWLWISHNPIKNSLRIRRHLGQRIFEWNAMPAEFFARKTY